MSSRSTPRHPPYPYMIRCAIQALGEENGSTVKSISDYIKAKYDELSLWHDQFILFYLNQLVESGEFAVVGGTPERYVARLCSSSPPALAASYLSPEFVIKYAIQSLNEEGGSTEELICRSILANFGELPWAPRKFLFFFINRLVERREIGPGAEPGRYVLVPKSSGPKSPVAQEGPNKAEEEGPSMPPGPELKESSNGGGGGGGGDGGAVKRGRGRPRKKRANASESCQSGTSAQEAQDATRPGRGRPRKKRTNASESCQSGTTAQEAQDATRPTRPVGPPRQPNLGPNEYVLALPAPRVRVNPEPATEAVARSS